MTTLIPSETNSDDAGHQPFIPAPGFEEYDVAGGAHPFTLGDLSVIEYIEIQGAIELSSLHDNEIFDTVAQLANDLSKRFDPDQVASFVSLNLLLRNHFVGRENQRFICVPATLRVGLDKELPGVYVVYFIASDLVRRIVDLEELDRIRTRSQSGRFSDADIEDSLSRQRGLLEMLSSNSKAFVNHYPPEQPLE